MKVRKKTLAMRLKVWGKYCFILMWIPFITLMIGIITMPTGKQGSVSFAEIPALVYYSLFPMGLFFIGTFFFFIASMVVGNFQHRRLLKNGKPAHAVIQKIVDTRTTVNDHPLVGFELVVHPADTNTFSAYAEQLVSRLSVQDFQPGRMVDVRYNPRTQAVVIVGLAGHVKTP